MSISESEREMAALVAVCALTDVKRLAKAFQQFKKENYVRGFEAAKAAAASLCRKSEEALRTQAEPAGEGSESLDSMAEACGCLAEEIEQLQPEVTR